MYFEINAQDIANFIGLFIVVITFVLAAVVCVLFILYLMYCIAMPYDYRQHLKGYDENDEG